MAKADGQRRPRTQKNVLAISDDSLVDLVMHVVLDDDLHAEPHVVDADDR